MEKAIYKGVEGVFIPIDEFKYIKEVINNNKLLFQELTKEIAKDNPNAFDF
jgi:hypothetical protein